MKRDGPTFLPRAGLLHRVALWSLLCALTAMCFAAPAKAADRKHTADMAWWKHDRFGMFIHWGLYSQAAGYWHGKPEPGAGEWLMNNMHLTRAEYATLAPKFDPVKFNADKWVSIAKAAGMKYLVITTMHHDGFCMFKTKATHYNVVDDTPWHTDPMALLAAACKKQGIKFCTYYSVENWHSKYQLPNSWNKGKPIYFPTRFAPGGSRPYLKYMTTQLGELIYQYHPALIWFDNSVITPWTAPSGKNVAGWTEADVRTIWDYVRGIDPSVIMNNRLDKWSNFKGFGDYQTPEEHIPPQGIPGPWETCMTINNTWGYKRQDKNFKSAATLITNLIKCASGGGNYLLNVGPTGLGVIPKPEVTRLMAMGRWLKVNGAAIYGSHRTPFKKAMPWGYITSKPGRLYLEVLHWQNAITVPMSNTVTKAYLLATGQSVTTSSRAKRVVVSLPAHPLNNRYATVIVVKYVGKLHTMQPVVLQSRNGVIRLRAPSAVMNPGATAHLETYGAKRDLGWWTVATDTATWHVEVDKPGTFSVAMDYACDPVAAGSTYQIQINGKSMKDKDKVVSTGAWSRFVRFNIGQAVITKAGRVRFELRPLELRGALMNLRDITLTPVR